MTALSRAQKRRIATLSKTIRASLEEVLSIARDAGCAHPVLFIECEGPTIHVMDKDHPEYLNADSSGMSARQQAIVFSLPDNLPPGSDVGAW